ncbi:DUF806 family protein [Schleiferilactobacillus harbinensis]|uniref:DUF806 family protein n=1 Tax=Schleiferilactobacillus harbinensis TaxID=304207 RepID=UPI0039ED0288
MSAVDDATLLLNQANISGIDDVFANNLPQEAVDNVNSTIVLVTDAADDPSDFGNDDFWSLNQEVEIQIWYSQQLETDPEIIELAMMKLFVHNNWQVAAVRQRTLDPDTQQLSNTFYFSRTKII